MNHIQINKTNHNQSNQEKSFIIISNPNKLIHLAELLITLVNIFTQIILFLVMLQNHSNNSNVMLYMEI